MTAMAPSNAKHAQAPLRVAGVMTGTSADGIDAVVCEITGAPPNIHVDLVQQMAGPLPAGHAQLVRKAEIEPISGAEWASLEYGLSTAIAELLLNLRAKAAFDLAGVHGQTVWHRPPPASETTTVQILDPWRIAQRIGVPVVSDFRRADLAAGGQGAPLAPWPHALLFARHLPAGGAFLNIGGIANVTLLPIDGDPDKIRAWDTGPGMMVTDALYRRSFGGPFDRDGRAAAKGRICESWLAAGLAHPFFNLAPPRSAGRETFGEAFVDAWLRHPAAATLSPADHLRSSLALTARTAAAALAGSPAGMLLLGGGGAHNPLLQIDLAAALPGWTVAPSTNVGWPVDAVEAAAFAVLAYERMHDRPGNLPAVTGARRLLRLGSIANPD